MVQLKLSALKQTKWYEYLIRFVFGGLTTVATGLVAAKYGPVIGGMFLAFPSIFPASVTLVQTHKKETEQKKGEGEQESKEEGKDSAAKTSAGTAMGSTGLFLFALVLWNLSTRLAPWLVLLLALAVWLAGAVIAWWLISGRRQEKKPAAQGSTQGSE